MHNITGFKVLNCERGTVQMGAASLVGAISLGSLIQPIIPLLPGVEEGNNVLFFKELAGFLFFSVSYVETIRTSTESMLHQEQEEGWPLGLQPLIRRVGLVGNRDLSEPISLDTWVTDSPTSSSNSSSDSDALSTGSSFRDRSITLGNLLGVATNQSAPVAATINLQTRPSRKNHRSGAWLSVILKAGLLGSRTNSPTSLGQFLAVERRAGNFSKARKSVGFLCAESGDAHAVLEANSLLGDHFAVPLGMTNQAFVIARNVQRTRNKSCGGSRNHIHGIPAFLSCVCSDSAM